MRPSRPDPGRTEQKAESFMSKSTLYTGANFVSHDASVFGICDGECFAISEERFTRFKHDALWPLRSLEALRDHFRAREIGRVICGIPMAGFGRLQTMNVREQELFMRKLVGGRYLKDYESRKRELWHGAGRFRLLASKLAQGAVSFVEVAHWIKGQRTSRPLQAWVEEYLARVFPGSEIKVRFYDHHECHAHSVFGVSGFEDALVITMDGWGDGAFTSIYHGGCDGLRLLSRSESIRVDTSAYDLTEEVRHVGIFDELSVGHAYSIVTWLLDFTPCADEGKVEALAAYASPDPELLALFDSTVRVDSDRIEILRDKFVSVFHDPASHQRMSAMPREVVSATIQRFLEDVYLKLVREAASRHGMKNICLAGGVAANVILNMKIFADLGLNIFVIPSMADDGTSMGAAIRAASDELAGEALLAFDKAANGMPYYGTQYSAEQTLAALESNHGLPVRWEWLGDSWPERCAELICEQQAIGALFHGRCEFGPRALGNRSIVADLRNRENTKRINLLVKSRPGFQPFCPSFMDDEMDRLFEQAYPNRHMTCAFRMKEDFVDAIPCAVHVDNTARVQFVTATSNADFYRLLGEIRRRSGFGGVLNTSFNKHGRTICENPLDALTDFVDCNIDFLMLNGYLVTRVAAVDGSAGSFRA